MAVDTKNIDYKPVNLAKREIRLLEIQAAHDIHDPIVARLVTVRVTDDLEFVGLSALVGDLNDIEHIWLSNRKIGLPANIAEALRNVRAVFRRHPPSLYQVDSNASSQATLPPTTITTTTTTTTSTSSRPPPRPSTNKSSASPRTTGTGSGRKTPGWLKHLLKGFQTLLPDANSRASGAARDVPLRVWLDCVCLHARNPKEEQHRRAHMALAYGAAKLVVGWLGPKDETTDLAVRNLRTMDALTPASFGEPGDREAHPEHYGPRMDFLKPLGEAWRNGNLPGSSNDDDDDDDDDDDAAHRRQDPREGLFFKASENFLMRPFFHRQWILEEVALSRFPAFLMGDEIISWMQMLKWNRLNEEFKERGCVHIPDEYKVIAEMIDIGTVHTLLEDFNQRRDKSDLRGLVKVNSSTTASSVDSTAPPPPAVATRAVVTRPFTSHPRGSKHHLAPKYGF